MGLESAVIQEGDATLRASLPCPLLLVDHDQGARRTERGNAEEQSASSLPCPHTNRRTRGKSIVEKHNILKQIQPGESATLEFKEALPGKNELAKLIGALANSEGGRILVGVGDRGQIVGIEWSDETGRFIAEVATNNCQPPIRVKIEPLEVEGKRLICIEVPQAEGMLHSAGGRFYIRVGSTNRLLAPDEIRHRMFERGMMAYDEMPVYEATFEDLDEGKVQWFLERRAEFAHVEVPDLPVERVLLNLNGNFDDNFNSLLGIV